MAEQHDQVAMEEVDVEGPRYVELPDYLAEIAAKIDVTSPDFVGRRTQHLLAMAAEHGEDLAQHWQHGLGEEKRRAVGEHKDRIVRIRDWGNVTSHCLLQASRVEIFGGLLGLPDDTVTNLKRGAVLHDAYKRREVELTKQGNPDNDPVLDDVLYMRAQDEADEALRAAGIDERVIYLATSTGHETAEEAEQLLTKTNEELTPEEVAWLVMHYVDDYTRTIEWVEHPEIVTTEDGEEVVINDFNRRMDYNRGQYPQRFIEVDGQEAPCAKQERVGALVEARLAELVSDAVGVEIDPKMLPSLVDIALQERINSAFEKA